LSTDILKILENINKCLELNQVNVPIFNYEKYLECINENTIILHKYTTFEDIQIKNATAETVTSA